MPHNSVKPPSHSGDAESAESGNGFPATDGGAENGDRLRVRSLSRGLQILSMFMVERPEVTLKEIVSETGLPRPTAYRLAKTLEDAFFLVFDAASGKYRLGPAMIPALYLLQDHSNLVSLLQQELQDLAEESGEHASLAVDADTRAVVIASAESSQNPFHLNLAVGRVQEGYASAHQKVFAAFKGPTYLAALLTGKDSAPISATGGRALGEEVAAIRREGVASDDGQFMPALSGVASPVRDRSGAVVASVAVVTSTERYDADRRERLTQLVRVYGARMSQRLGYSPSGEKAE